MYVARARLFAVFALLFFGLAGCMGEPFATSYDTPVPPDVARNWHVVDVRVSVPKSLTVSEAKALVPAADIVWREDPPGDRHAQVAVLMRNAIRKGAAGLHGQRPVRLEVVMSRFHALTFEAEQLNIGAGVHNIFFTIRVVDAGTGAVLNGPTAMEASLPAMSGVKMIEARARGETQRSQITAHVAKTIAGWLGTGQDQRGAFDGIGA